VIRIDVEALYIALDSRRRAAHLRWRDIATEIGVSASTFSRMAYGALPSVDNLARMLVWLGDTDLKPYLTEETR
jgi:transcriptional regulator with XRE-family HTH domain